MPPVPDEPPVAGDPLPVLLDGVAPPEPEPELPLALAPPDDAALEDPVEDELEAVVEVVAVAVVVVGVAGALATDAVGTVSGGAPEVSAAVEDPLPQAASAPDNAIGAHSNATFLITAI